MTWYRAKCGQGGRCGREREVGEDDDNNRGKGCTIKTVHCSSGGAEEIVRM